MKVHDSGHHYTLQGYDKDNLDENEELWFMKRIGDKFPGNVGKPHSGTNCQEVMRVLINRIKYLDNQKPCIENKIIVYNLRENILLLENRALEEKGLKSVVWPLEIELLPPCKICGHTYPHTCQEPK